jgi:hypothetical protein|tara:strand:+ start:1984 stop:3327 length:1344 start_codon:yes stop_codon:yes gene_type:complete
MSALEKYLDQYAEPESLKLRGFPTGFSHGLVVPMYDEAPCALDPLIKYIDTINNLLIIVVINRPPSDTNATWAVELLAHPFLLNNPLTWQSSCEGLALYSSDTGGLLIVDRCVKGAPIPIEQGVGLARKIGADILCSLINQRKVTSPWIYNTDADALLPDDYFQQTNHLKQIPKYSQPRAALIFPFRHIFVDDTPKLPTLLYEFSLHYYVAGLHSATSPYAYHTVGSTICVDYLHYAKVRGFPKRSGAEDFYLLNKLAKTGRIDSLISPIIQLQARESIRAPFGTGRAVINLAESADLLSMPLYNPQCFHYLKFFIELTHLLTQKPDSLLGVASNLTTRHDYAIDIELIVRIAQQFRLQEAVDHCFKHGKTHKTRQRQMTHWFDGFRTLKFIHYLRDNGLPSTDFRYWLEHSDKHNPPYNAVLAMLADRISEEDNDNNLLPSDNSLT